MLMILILITFYWISCENFLIEDVSYKSLYGTKPFRIIFDKVHGYVRKYDETKYLALFHSDEKYERILIELDILFMLKINMSDAYSHKYMKTKIESNNYLP